MHKGDSEHKSCCIGEKFVKNSAALSQQKLFNTNKWIYFYILPWVYGCYLTMPYEKSTIHMIMIMITCALRASLSFLMSSMIMSDCCRIICKIFQKHTGLYTVLPYKSNAIIHHFIHIKKSLKIDAYNLVNKCCIKIISQP